MILNKFDRSGVSGFFHQEFSFQYIGLHFQDGEFGYFYDYSFFYSTHRLTLKMFSIDNDIDDDNDCSLCFNCKQYKGCL